jgi:hypothetical protein
LRDRIELNGTRIDIAELPGQPSAARSPLGETEAWEAIGNKQQYQFELHFLKNGHVT